MVTVRETRSINEDSNEESVSVGTPEKDGARKATPEINFICPTDSSEEFDKFATRT